jgi:hypothetical protein
MEKQALKSIFLTGPDMLKFPGNRRSAEQKPDDRGGFRRPLICASDNAAGLTDMGAGRRPARRIGHARSQ